MLTTLLTTGIIALLLNNYLKRNYHDNYEEIILSFSYCIIYLYSKSQILYTKLIKVVNKKIEENPKLLQLKNNFDLLITPRVTMIEYYKNGNLVDIITNANYDDCDFKIFSWLDDNKDCVNKKVMYNLNEPPTVSEVSDIKFLLIELKFEDNYPRKIYLKTHEFNFYIVGNIFTKQFFIYYLKQFFENSQENQDESNFSVKIIDHDVNSIELNFTDKNESILLEKNGYKLLNIEDN